MSTSLPDICAFKLVNMLHSEYNLPVVMICDNDVATMLRGLQNGAMFCLQKPLRMRQVEKLWQYAFRKIVEAEVVFEAMKWKCLQESAKSSTNGVSSQVRKRKLTDVENVEDWVLGLPASSNSTNDLHWKSLEIVGSGIHVAVSSEVLRHTGCPGLTIEYVNEELQNPQDLNATVFRHQANPPSGVQEMGLLPMVLLGSNPSPVLLPSTLQLTLAPVLLANTAQSSIQAPYSSTVAEAPPGVQQMGLLPTALLGSNPSSMLLPSTPAPVLLAKTAQSSIQAPYSPTAAEES